MNNKKNSNFNQGYSKYTKEAIDSSLTLNNSENEINTKNKKINRYPKGYLYVFFISIITVATFLICFLIKRPIGLDESNQQESVFIYGHMKWNDALSIAFAVGFFLNVMWLISRQMLSLRIRFTSKKMFEYFTFKQFRERKNLVVRSWASNDVKNFDEYIEYCTIKKKTTALMFYISFSIFTLLFIVSIILAVTVK